MWNEQGINTVLYFTFLYLSDLKALAQFERCTQFPCYNGGKCSIDPDTEQPYCLCSDHFIGPRCEISDNSTICESLNCSAIESCVFVRVQNKWKCLCDVSKYGSMCHTPLPFETTRVQTSTSAPEEKETSSSYLGIYIIVGSLVFTVSVFVLGFSFYHFIIKRRRPVIRVATTGGVSVYTMEAKDVPLSSVFAVAPSYEEACSNSDSPPSYEEAAQSSSQNFYHITAIQHY